MTAITDLVLAPLVPWAVLVLLVGVALALALLAIGLGRRGGWLRLAAVAALALALVNPSVSQEQREAIADVAVVVVDRSPSQDIGERTETAAAALADLQEPAAAGDALELRVVTSDSAMPAAETVAGAAPPPVDHTALFDRLAATLADVPARRRAGVVLITDGQVHDVPASAGPFGPLHVLLTGTPEEGDRRLTAVNAPGFALVGEVAAVTLRVDDLAGPGGASVTGDRARAEIRRDGTVIGTASLPVGRDSIVELPVEHGGANVFEITVEAGPAELTLANNRVALGISGVRDRLRVLLVSGEPHPGERTWRNILKSDPSVDLVHFTILRPPEKQDGTPIDELSLISFPIRELFEISLGEFDLIIFDRYRRRGVLPSLYFENIANYVRDGGAFLEASGPQFAAAFGLYDTALGSVLPGAPTGQIVEEGFRPRLAELGRRHPVTAPLAAAGGGAAGEAPRWGRWFRQIEVAATDGTTVLTGAGDRPLLILDRVGEGRVAQMMSDHIWLWARGFEGGGPQAELLRRLAHWLMREPELEENTLTATVDGREIAIERISLGESAGPVTVTAPDGTTTTVPLATAAPGRATARVAADGPGLYRVSGPDGLSALAVVGRPDPPEFADVRTTPDRLAPLVEETGGGLWWVAEDPVPALRHRPGGEGQADWAGEDWLALRANGDYRVVGTTTIPLSPVAVALILILGTLAAAWRRESG